MGEEDMTGDQDVVVAKERAFNVPHESKLEKTFRAICLNGAIIAIGLSLALIGAALQDLQCRTKSDISEVMKIFVGRGMGLLVGSITSTYLLSRGSQACWITFALAILAVTTATVPSCTSVALLSGSLFVQGIACGIVKEGCGFICRQHFSRIDLTWSRVLFVSFGIGAFLAPLLLVPFTSLHHDGESHVPHVLMTSTSGRSSLIAPNILARLYRRRRSSVENETMSLLDNITGSRDTEMHSTYTAEINDSYLQDGKLLKIPSALSQSTESGSGIQDGNKLVSPEQNSSISVAAKMWNVNSTAMETTLNSSIMKDVLSTSLPAVEPVPSVLSTTFIDVATSKAVPKKPQLANGEILNPDGKVADSSKFRGEIRKSVKEDIPPDVENLMSSLSTITPRSSTTSVLINSSTVMQSLGITPALSTNRMTSRLESTITSLPNIQLSTNKTVLADPQPSTMRWSMPTVSIISSSPLTGPPEPIINRLSTPISRLSAMPPAGVTETSDNQTRKLKFCTVWETKYSYWLAAFIIGIAAVSFAFYWVLCPRVYQVGMSLSSDDPQMSDQAKVSSQYRFMAFLVSTIFHFLYAGLELTFVVLITSYAIIHLDWSWKYAVLLSLVYWGAFAAGRFVTFVLASCLRQWLMMVGGLLLCIMVTGTTFFTLQHGTGLGFATIDTIIWIPIGLLGFCMSAVLPVGTSEINRFLPHHFAIFKVLGTAVGEMALPPIIGVFLMMDDAIWLAFILLALFVLCMLVAMAIRFLVRSSDSRFLRGSRAFPSLQQEDVPTDTNDETELLAKSVHSQSGSPLNGTGNGTQVVTHTAIQSLMKNISNVKKD